MKTRTIAIAAAALCIPFVALAAEFRAGEDQIRIIDEAINGNLYVGAGNVTIDSAVEGDSFIGGGQVDVNGTVQDDLFIGGGNIRVTGDVGGDVRIGGGNVRIEGKIGGELMVGGGNVEITDSAEVSGQTFIGAGQIVIAGSTGSVKASAESIRLESTARINGDLEYISPNTVQKREGAIVTGATKHTAPPSPHDEKVPALAALAGGSIIWLVASLAMLLLFVYALPSKAATLAADWKNNFWLNMAIGFVFLVVSPIAGFILMATIIGIPLGIGVLLLYPILLFIGKLAGIIGVGVWLRSLLDKAAGVKVDWVSALMGLVVLALIGLVPLLGALAVFVSFLAGLGALVRYDWKLIQNLRNQKQI